MRATVVGVVLFGLGVLVGVFAPALWAPPWPSGIDSHWEATLYLPAPVTGDSHLSDDNWKAALAEFTQPFGGATLIGPVEGLWHAADGTLQREAVRPVVVSFPTEKLPAFRARLEILRERLRQEAIYVRYERPLVELYVRPR